MNRYKELKKLYISLKNIQDGGKLTHNNNYIDYQDSSYHYQYIPIVYPIKISPEIELVRAKEYNNIRDQFRDVIKQYKIVPKKQSVTKNADKILTRYIFHNFSQKQLVIAKDGLFHYNDNTINDHVIAVDIMSVFQDVNVELAKEIEKTLQINNLFDNAINQLSKIISNEPVYKKKITNQWIMFESIEAIEAKDREDRANDKIKDRTKYNFPTLTIAPSIYNRLKSRYEQYKSLSPHDHELDDLVFVLLQRYQTLSSEGHQWGMPYEVRETFKDMGFNFECFASALNHYLDHYCSMFYDIEKYFMSRGPFQNITYFRGLYMANPPYELGLLNNMVSGFIESLETSKEHLAFMYGLPDWTRFGESFKFIDMSNESKYYKYHIRFDPYVFPWHDFMDYNKVYYIPQSFRYVLANYDIDIKRIDQIIAFWRNLKNTSK